MYSSHFSSRRCSGHLLAHLIGSCMPYPLPLPTHSSGTRIRPATKWCKLYISPPVLRKEFGPRRSGSDALGRNGDIDSISRHSSSLPRRRASTFAFATSSSRSMPVGGVCGRGAFQCEGEHDFDPVLYTLPCKQHLCFPYSTSHP